MQLGIYAVLSWISLLADLCVFCANFRDTKMRLCYFLRFLHVWKPIWMDSKFEADGKTPWRLMQCTHRAQTHGAGWNNFNNFWQKKDSVERQIVKGWYKFVGCKVGDRCLSSHKIFLCCRQFYHSQGALCQPHSCNVWSCFVLQFIVLKCLVL